MAQEKDALSEANFGGGLWLSDFPAKIRVLTRDPMVYGDSYGNTKYAFAVFNIDHNKVQILDKGPGFPKRFQEINADPDFGGDIRKIDLKITTNGKNGIDVRYTITPIGNPGDPTPEQIKTIVAEGFDLAEKVKKNNPSALRLSEINAGAQLSPSDDVQTAPVESEDIVIEDIGEEPINLDDIPF